MHEIMGNMLGSLYTCPRGLLWRRRWKLRVMVRKCFLWSNSPDFWVAPHIIWLNRPQLQRSHCRVSHFLYSKHAMR
jgi:hypothetical protein